MFIKNVANIQALKRRVNNILTGEKGAEWKESLLAILDEMEKSTVEFDDDVFTEKVKAILAGEEPNAKVEEAIANAIAKRMQAVNDSVKKELPVAVKNQIAAAILRANGREAVENAVKAVLVKNDITGYTFSEVVDYAIVENWGDLNPLFKQLHKTFYTKFFYNDEEVKTATLLAKQWDKTGEVEKTIQQIAVEGKEIRTKYIYKRQRAAQEDLDEIEKAGQTTNFLRFINEELDRMIVNTIVMAILIGDNVNTGTDKVTTFEGIASKSESDAFTTFVTGAATLEDMRKAADAVKNPYGKKKTATMTVETLTAISAFKYSGTGSIMYRSKDEIAAEIGVDEIITVDILNGAKTGANKDVHAVFALLDGYWVNEKNAISVAYPKYEENAMNYQKERNIGGAIHDLLSTSVLHAA